MTHGISGRKVFILNPHTVVTDDLVGGLLAAEYEVYLLKEQHRAIQVLRQFPHSVLFINIDSGPNNEFWEIYVRNMMKDPALNTIRIGILSYDASPELAKRYLMDIGVPCGFVRLRLGVQESTRIMLTTLRANEAKGRRKYVRVDASQDPHANFNVPFGGELLEGKILNISAVGMAATIEPAVHIPQNSKLPDMQLRLRTGVVRVTGIFLNRREDADPIYVFLFDHTIETMARFQIRMYIHKRLQEEVNRISGEHQ